MYEFFYKIRNGTLAFSVKLEIILERVEWTNMLTNVFLNFKMKYIQWYLKLSLTLDINIVTNIFYW